MNNRTIIYDWPATATFGRVIPKSKIYEHTRANTALKDLFVREVDKIVWSHKLAPGTINLAATEKVAEIQVFCVYARSATLDSKVLHAIDKAVPFPLIFEVVSDGKVKVVAAHKRPSDADNSRWVVGSYFEGDWQPADGPRSPLPVAVNMQGLYEQLLEPLVVLQANRVVYGIREIPQSRFTETKPEQQLSLEEQIVKAEAIKAQVRTINQLKTRLAREKQFNKRVAINAELRVANQELAWLTAANCDVGSGKQVRGE